MISQDLIHTDRIKQLKKKILDEDRFLSVEQALLITESYRENEDDPRVLQRAKAFARSAGHIQINIDPLELIVGNRSAASRAGIVFPESGINWLAEEINTLPARPQDKFNVREQDVRVFLEEIVPYWKGKTLENAILADEQGQSIKKIEKVVKINQKDHAQGHIIPDVAAWLQDGPALLKNKVSKLLATTSEKNKIDFYSAQILVLEAASAFMMRYADLALKMAENEDFKEYARQLLKIHSICKKLAQKPAENFHEAVQSTWFLFVLLQLESNASSFSPGRMDQYLFPFYQKDKAGNIINDQDVLEILEALWLKFNQIVYMRNAHSASFFAGFPIGFNVAIGGQTSDGKSAVNELSWIMLKAQEHVGLPQPNLSARLYKDIPPEFIKECARVIGKGSGMPQILNDEAIIPALKNQGISHEDAMNYGIVGCVELSTHGNNLGWSDAAMFNMLKIIELAVNNGVCLLSGKQLGLKTGYLNAFDSYELFEIAIEKQMDHFIDLMMENCHFVDKMHAQFLPSPFLSCVIDNCIEKGMDVTAGGAHYNFSGIQFIQVANVADSLAVIKSAVFDKNEIDPEFFLKALKSNYQGREELRQWILENVPKYGNDVKWVDELGLKWAQKFTEKISRYKNARGGKHHTGFYTVSAHVPMGKNVGASADGRLSGKPLADGGLSAVYGRDVSGPTALLKSVSRIDSMLGSNGTLLNMKMQPKIFRSDSLLSKFVHLLMAVVHLKISHVQFNVVTREDLKKAQKNPEEYRNLTIRVAGYTAFFTELAENLQNEIIERTEYGV